MKNGTCLKCNSATVHEVDTRDRDSGIPLTMWRSAGIVYYICVTCGYAEMYASEQDLARIAAEKPRVPPA